ncbi:WS/DGAT domain-containing protein [Euzebya sp.]|uniref:WS/DGAT domain-containing protein n=1 Tax=Euzebya sp. TaxID=1971409 RepID=UPI0035123D19
MRAAGSTPRSARPGTRRPASSPPVVGPLVRLAATPLGRWYIARQRGTNVIATNVVGPPVHLHLLGAGVEELLPIMDLQGNIGLVLCTFSYAGEVALAVTADAARFPDLDVLLDAMARDWRVLADAQATPARASKAA